MRTTPPKQLSRACPFPLSLCLSPSLSDLPQRRAGGRRRHCHPAVPVGRAGGDGGGRVRRVTGLGEPSLFFIYHSAVVGVAPRFQGGQTTAGVCVCVRLSGAVCVYVVCQTGFSLK